MHFSCALVRNAGYFPVHALRTSSDSDCLRPDRVWSLFQKNNNKKHVKKALIKETRRYENSLIVAISHHFQGPT